ncbi:MAG: FAD-binding protein [Nitrospirae bacterium]|nr:FAD-binding protein [Nitrospirota bacterium]MBI3351573.1 FAD-binding protein [Nitrospirota bacterium]
MLSVQQLRQLEGILPRPWTSSEKEDLICYGFDATRIESIPDVLVRPTSAQEISKILIFANREKIPVVPRGMGSGFSGGTVPVKGGIVLSLERMNRILTIDEDNLMAVVEPGVITGELHRTVQAKGLYYPPDPTSSDFCTIGGNIAEAASGPHSVKYGGTRDYVLGLEIVLPTGEMVRTGGKTVKRAVAYDLTRLMVGSEGTLGVVTQANLKLLPFPEYRQSLLAVFPSIQAAARCISHIIRSKFRPSVLEYMDEASLKIVEAHSRFGLPKEAKSILLIETDGSKRTAMDEAEQLTALCRENHAIWVEVAEAEEDKKKIWKARKALSQSLYQLKPAKINEDIVVPRSKIAEMVCGLDGLSEKYRLIIVSFGHAGEGNLHVNIMADPKNRDEWEKAQQAVKEVFELTLKLGGALSGEHGIGLTKRPYLFLEMGPAEIQLLRNIKKAFDPNGILNPGKIF